MIADKLSICIIGKDAEGHLPTCIDLASKICRKIFYIDMEGSGQSKLKASELGIRVVDSNSLPSVLQTKWAIFIKPNEMLILSSPKDFKKVLKDKQVQGYGVYTRSIDTKHLLEDYQWVRKLEQFKKTGRSAFVAGIEPRLVRKNLVKDCLAGLITGSTENISWICEKIALGIVVESIPDEEPDNEERPKDHDMRCLKGEVVYDITPEEDMVELSERYTGFRIVHKGHLEGFMDAAGHGFGHIKMYIPLLDFLCKEGFFEEAKNLFEQWIEHRPDDTKNFNVQLMGAMIYSNLLEIDKAIDWFEKIIETSESALSSANLGKLYLIKGDKDRAIEYLRRSKDTKGDMFLKQRILPIIDKDDWRPLTLSLCMIAKDEEGQIGKSLESVDGIADEIIVVDTGSSDRTREIIREFGGKVIETKWEDDFSKAKNLTLAHATGDYILFMDADEFIAPGNKFALALFKKLLPAERNIAFGIKVEPVKKTKALSMSYLDRIVKREEDEYQIRLFPRKEEIQFQGMVFEDVNESLKSAGVQLTRNDLLKITHSMEGRSLRDRRKAAAVEGAAESITSPQKALACGLLFLRVGDFDSAYPWLIKVCELDAKLSAKIGALYSKQNKLEMAKDILTGALKQFPDSPELILSMAEVYYKEENYNEVINMLANRIEAIDKNLESEDAARAVYYHGIASLETGNLGDGIEYLAFAHEKNPANIVYKIAGIYAFSKVDEWEEALQVASQIADEEGIEIASEVKDFVDVGQIFVEMNRNFTGTGKTEEANLCQKVLEDIIKTKISGEENIQRMSAVIEGIGSHG